ncbi:MAG: M48 family metalloprotease [Pyrinomonadaceae bacterium]
MYFLLGISLTLAFLLIVNMGAALLASAVWRLTSVLIEGVSANIRAQIIFALRVGPVAAALVFVFAFVVPAYLLHEPGNSGEVVSGKLALIAIVSSIAVIFAAARVFRTWRVTRRLSANWQNEAVGIGIAGIDVPVFRIVHPFPVMAVVGIFRPRMFIARQVFESLGPGELKAALAHENGHLRSHDNLKRTILQICRDLVIVPLGKNLDRAWAENVEAAADEYAAYNNSTVALDLASALVKLARIAPHRHTQPTFSGSYLFDAQCVDVTERVRRLVKFADVKRSPSARRSVAPTWLWPAALTGLLALHFTDQRLLLTTHEAIERFVWMIQ